MDRAVELSIAFLEAQPVGAARVLEGIPADDAAAFLDQVPVPSAALVLGLMQPGLAASLLERLTAKKAATLLSQSVVHARALLLRALPDTTRSSVLSALPKRESAMMRGYLTHDPGSVGAWMDAPKAVFSPDTTVGGCLTRIRQLGKRLGSLVFVVDGEKRLMGTVDMDGLLGADDNAPLEDLMRRDITSLSPQAPLTRVLTLTAWDTALSLPVADRNRRLVGVLHFDSLREGLVVDRGTAGAFRVNILLMHLAHAFMVTFSGLLQVATTASAPTRISGSDDA